MQIAVTLLALAALTSAAPSRSNSTKIVPLYAMSYQEQVAMLSSRLGVQIEGNYRNLPPGGKVYTPWAGSYWPSAIDSINADWQKTGYSPAAKYALANGIAPQYIEDAVSRSNGVDGQQGTSCTSDSQCQNGAACAIRRGRTSGICIPTWFGLCHGWAPAAFMEREPVCPVTRNGVRFEVNDLKALVTYLWANVQYDNVWFGERCNQVNMNLDRYGRPAAPECLDINAGTFHMLVTNLLGRAGRSFVAEVIIDGEVWNHPMASYMLSAPRVMSPSQAMRQFFGEDNYVFNPAAKQIVYYSMTARYTVESDESDNTSFTRAGTLDRFLNTQTYEYILEVDGYGNILGGEFVNGSKTKHFDFIWTPVRGLNPSAQVAGIQYGVVQSMIAESANSRC